MKSYKPQILTEVGNSKNPYPFTLRVNKVSWQANSDAGEAEFKTKTGLEYFIQFDAWEHFGNKTVDISFGVDSWGRGGQSKDSMMMTDEGLKEMFRVMATVVEATRRFLRMQYKKHDQKIDLLTFSSVDMGKHGIDRDKVEQRTKLYMAFIKKNLKDIKIEYSSFDSAEIRVLDSFYDKIK